MKRSILFTLLALVLLGATQLPAGISAYAFGDYYFVLKNHNAALEDLNGFWLRRIYLTYDADISDKLKARARLEMHSDAKFGASQVSITPFIKDAYIAYQFAPLHKLQLGIQESLTWANIEKFYGYRHLEKTAFDLYKVRSSRDFGLSMAGSFDQAKKFNYTVLFGNYSSYRQETDKYKQIALRLTVNPTANLMFEASGDFATVSATKKSSLFQGFAGYTDDWGRVGLNFGQETVSEDGKDDVDFGVFSAFTVVKLGKKFEFLVRHDMTTKPQPYGQSDFLVIEKGYKTNLTILGMGWNIHPKFQIMPNIKMVSYKENNGVKPGSDTYFNVTFYYQF